jgi:hypothetical protein
VKGKVYRHIHGAVRMGIIRLGKAHWRAPASMMPSSPSLTAPKTFLFKTRRNIMFFSLTHWQ